MNRLTGRLHDNWVYLLGSTRQNTKEFNLDNQIAIAMQKLAAYEDIGFEPEEIKEALEKQLNGEWIPVSERLPEEDEEVFVTTIGNQVCWAFRYLDEWNTYLSKFENEDVLAWQPLPEPYKEVKND